MAVAMQNGSRGLIPFPGHFRDIACWDSAAEDGIQAWVKGADGAPFVHDCCAGLLQDGSAPCIRLVFVFAQSLIRIGHTQLAL